MLGPLIMDAAEVRDQQIAQVTGAAQLGPLIITPEDQARALVAAGLAPQVAPSAAPVSAGVGAPDKGLTVREIQQQLRENPASVAALLSAEAARAVVGLEVRATVLKAGRAVALAQGDTGLVEKVDALLTALPSAE